MAAKLKGMALVGVLLAGGLVVGCQKEKAPDANAGPFTGEPSTVVGKVDGQSITFGEVEKLVTRWKESMGGAPGMPERELQQKALDNIINRKLFYGAATKAGTVPADSTVTQYIAMLKNSFGADGFQTKLAQQGLTEDQLRTELGIDMAIQSYMEKSLPDTLNATPELARKFYDENPDKFESGEMLHAHHILVRTPTGATEEQKAAARRKAERLLAQVRGGVAFEKVATDSSEDGSASRGGDLGRFGHGSMVPAFEDAAYKLAVGQVSDVVETQFGYHIIKLDERFPSQKQEWDQRVEGVVTQQLTQERQKAYIDKLVEQLRANAKVTKKI
jgi:parvulin-like peptidyl-prolyl isomerase